MLTATKYSFEMQYTPPWTFHLLKDFTSFNYLPSKRLYLNVLAQEQYLNRCSFLNYWRKFEGISNLLTTDIRRQWPLLSIDCTVYFTVTLDSFKFSCLFSVTITHQNEIHLTNERVHFQSHKCPHGLNLSSKSWLLPAQDPHMCERLASSFTQYIPT